MTPVDPPKKAIGRNTADSTSAIAISATCNSFIDWIVASRADMPGFSSINRSTFSTTTMASSTRMPIEKISANSETRLSVKPIAQEANNVSASVSTTAAPTTSASRLPSANNTSSTTDIVAKNSFWMSFCALSVAVWP